MVPLRFGFLRFPFDERPEGARPGDEIGVEIGHGLRFVPVRTTSNFRRSRDARTRAPSAQVEDRSRRLDLDVRGNRFPCTAEHTRAVTGEAQVAVLLDRLAEFDVVALHHCRIRRSRSTIDHLVVAPSGVYVVDTADVDRTRRAAPRVQPATATTAWSSRDATGPASPTA